MDRQTATGLLTDIIAQTNRFQHPEITSRTLQDASALVTAGADYQRALRVSRGSEPLAQLLLWGKILENLAYDNDAGMCWSVLAESCFSETQTAAQEIPRLLLRLYYAAPREVAAIFWEDPPQSKIYSPFGMRALITGTRPNPGACLRELSFVEKNNFFVIPLQGKEIYGASCGPIALLRSALSKT